MKEKFMQKSWVVWLGALICCFLWGSAFPCIKIGYGLMEIESGDTAAQILYAGIRFFLAGVLAIIIGSLGQKKLLYPSKKAIPKVIKLSMFQTVLQYLFFYVGLAHTTGVRASIIEGVNVFVVIVVASMIFHQEKLTARKLIGGIIGFAGVVLVNLAGGSAGGSFSLLGDGFIFLSTVAYGFSSVYLKHYSKEYNTVMLSGYQFVFGGVIMAICGLLAGGRLTVWSGSGIAMLIYLALVSAVAYSLWGILLTYNPVSKVAVFGFMNPVFGVLLSALFLSEKDTLGWSSILALVLVCLGIYIVNHQPTGLEE